jgi:hypothetical protein
MSRLTSAEQHQLSVDQFAFPEKRKEALVDASYVRNAVARFDQVEGVSDAERDVAWHASKPQPRHSTSRFRRVAIPSVRPPADW